MKPQMRLLSIVLDDDELPRLIQVAMTIDVAERIAQHVPGFEWFGRNITVNLGGKDVIVGVEAMAFASAARAAEICKTFGHMTPTDEYTHVIWGCLAGSLFNRFYDNGVDEFLEV